MDMFATLWERLCLPNFFRELLPKENIVGLNSRQLKLNRLLGEGGFSLVYLASDIQTGAQFALKKVRCPFGQESMAQAMREVFASKILDHGSIIKVVDHAKVQEHDGSMVLYILLPYFAGGTLQDLIDLNRQQGNKISEDLVLRYMLDVSNALVAMHEHRAPASDTTLNDMSVDDDVQLPLMQADINSELDTEAVVAYAHFDVKPGNVMLDEQDRAVLMDFGSFKKARRRIYKRSDAIAVQDEAAEHSTMPYRAPELFDCVTGSTVTEKVDIWSLGCVVYALLYGNSPFETSHTESGSIAMAVLNGHYDLPSGVDRNAPLNLLIRDCLNTSPDKRPSARTIAKKLAAIINDREEVRGMTG